jgi:hypothetical protein
MNQEAENGILELEIDDPQETEDGSNQALAAASVAPPPADGWSAGAEVVGDVVTDILEPAAEGIIDVASDVAGTVLEGVIDIAGSVISGLFDS